MHFCAEAVILQDSSHSSLNKLSEHEFNESRISKCCGQTEKQASSKNVESVSKWVHNFMRKKGTGPT